jgi:hypothetical protein
MDDTGEPVAPEKVVARYSTACGCIARDFIPISYQSWAGRNGDPTVVLAATKEHCWNKLRELFDFPDGTDLTLARKRALELRDTSWKWMKYVLNKEVFARE